jgi:hypothetical protein
MTEPTELDRALEQIRQKVNERRAAGEYPLGYEEELDAPFNAVMGTGRAVMQLDSALARLRAIPPFSPSLIATTSRAPAGSAVHSAVAKLVTRQTSGILQQVQRHREATDAVLAALVRSQLATQAAAGTSRESAGHDSTMPESPWTPERIDELLHRLAVLEQVRARLDTLESRLAAVEASTPGPDPV